LPNKGIFGSGTALPGTASNVSVEAAAAVHESGVGSFESIAAACVVGVARFAPDESIVCSGVV